MMKRKRLLFLASRVPWPPIGGDRLKNIHLLPELAKYFDLTLVLMGNGPLAPDARKWLAQFGAFHYFARSRARYALNIVRSPMHLPRPLQTSLYYFPDVQRLVNRLAPSHDAIFCSLVRTSRYAEHLQIPRVCDLSDSIGLHYQHSLKHVRHPFRRLLYSAESKLLLAYEAAVLKEFDQAFFLSHEEMQHFGQSGKSTWIPLGTNPLLLTREERDPAAAASVVFLGKMNYRPNVLAVEWFVREVMPLLPRHLRLTIVGSHPSARVQALASERVRVTGFLPDPYPVLRGALAVVAPMLTGGGVQNKLLEAMALGCLTINSSRAVRPLKNVQAGKHLLVADTPAEFASAIAAVDRDPTLYTGIGLAAREYIKANCNWLRSGQMYRDAIEKAIAAHQKRRVLICA